MSKTSESGLLDQSSKPFCLTFILILCTSAKHNVTFSLSNRFGGIGKFTLHAFFTLTQSLNNI